MRRISFSKILAGLVIMTGLSNLPMAAANQISHYLHYDDTPVIGTDTLGGVTYSTFSYGDLFNSGEPGKPSLPVDYIRFSVPYNATNFSATVTWRMNVSYNLDHLLYPCQAPRWMNDTTPATITLPDTAAYYSGESYPSQRAWVVDEGFLEGENHIVTVAVMPFSYSHSESSDLVSLRKTGTLRLSYELSDSLAIYPIVREDSALREEGYRLAQSMVVNPNQVKSFTVSYNPIGTGVGPIGPINPNGVLPGDGVHGGSLPFFPSDSLTRDSDYVDPNPGMNDDVDPICVSTRYPYLIVTTNELFHSMRRLAALKRQKGYNVKIVTLDEIYSSPLSGDGDVVNGRLIHADEAGKIRQFLRSYFSTYGTQYVLLAGKVVPFKSVDGLFSYEHVKGHGDLYFSDLNGDWIESIDIEPDLYVGRLLGTSDYQFDSYTDKLFRYELNPGKGDFSYLRTALFTEGKDFNDYWLHGLSRCKETTLSILPNQISLNEDINNNYPTGNDIIDSINSNHPSFICSFNHGGPSFIKLYGRDSQNRRYFLLPIDSIVVLPDNYTNIESGNGLNRMQNKNFPMIYYSLSCHTMPFNKDPILDVDMNMGESFTMGKDYGGPAYIGNTNSVEKMTVELLAYNFAKRISRNNYVLGRADALSKIDRSPGLRTSMAVYHNYLGDPLLEMWTGLPMIQNGITISRSDSTISISNIDVDSVKIAYYSNECNLCYYMFASSNAIITNVSPNGTIMLYKHNYIPFIAPMELQNYEIMKSQYVIASDVFAGNSINNNRTSGDVIVKSGTEYEIEASGNVTLQGGFKVEKGALFAVYPSSF